MKLSICQRDFTDAMTSIGRALADRLQNACIDVKLADADVGTPGLQPDCKVFWRFAQEDSAQAIPPCPQGVTASNLTEACWRLVSDTTRCPRNGQRLEVLRTASMFPDVAPEFGRAFAPRSLSISPTGHFWTPLQPLRKLDPWSWSWPWPWPWPWPSVPRSRLRPSLSPLY